MVVLMQNPAVMSGRIGDHDVLFNLNDRQLHLLNSTGAAAWRGLKAPATLDSLASQLAYSFGAGVDDVRTDLEQLLTSFDQTGLCLAADQVTGVNPERDVRSNDTGHTRPRHGSSPDGQRHMMLGPFLALSIPVTVAVDDDALASDLDRILDPIRGRLDDVDGADSVVAITIDSPRSMANTLNGDPSDMWTIRVEGKPALRFGSRDRVIRQVVAEVNGGPLHHLEDAVVFHAAAAEWNAGVVLFPGVSNAGKSTLITQLVHCGHKYVTDEAALVRIGSRNVEPFTKSITLEPASQRVVRELVSGLTPGQTTVDVDPREVGAGQLSAGGPIAAMIFPTYRQGASTELTELDQLDAFRSLLANAFTFDLVGQRGFDTIVELANEVPAFRLEHGGDSDHLDVIDAAVANLARP